jgi:hypothetical protein
LCTLRRAGCVEHVSGTAQVALTTPACGGQAGVGGTTAVAAAEAAEAMEAAAAPEAEVARLEASVLRPLRGTGTALALSCALALRPPRLAFPIGGRCAFVGAGT